MNKDEDNVDGHAEGRDGTRSPIQDPATLKIRDLLTGLTVAQLWAVLGTLAILASGSFTLGWKVSSWQNGQPATATKSVVPPSLVQVETPKPTPLKVVFVDSHAHVYDSRDNASNADYLSRHIRTNENFQELIEVHVENTDQFDSNGQRKSPRSIADLIGEKKPDLVVVHRSAFFTKTVPDKDEKQLVDFLNRLREISGLKTVFLVYSRRNDTNSKYAARLEGRTGLPGRIYPYEFDALNPFADDGQRDHFLNTLLLLAHARRDQSSKR